MTGPTSPDADRFDLRRRLYRMGGDAAEAHNQIMQLQRQVRQLQRLAVFSAVVMFLAVLALTLAVKG